MSDDTLTFPELDLRPGPIVVMPPTPPATLRDTALASFLPIEAHMRTLAARYRDVAYDVTTPKGMKDAKAARLVLREEGRFAVQRLVQRLKDEANDLKRTLDTRGDEVIALTKPVEDAIHSQIEAEEQRIKAERAERARIEVERVEALQAKLAALSSWIDRCREPGMTSVRIAFGMKALGELQFSEAEWQEFLPRAHQRRDEVLEVMRQIHESTLAAEIQAQETERLRKVAEQQAAELAELRRRDAERQADELAAQRAESERLALAEVNRAAHEQITTPPGSAGGQVDGCRAPESQPDGCSGPVPQDQTSLPASPTSEGPSHQQVLKAEGASPDATDRVAPANTSPVGGPMGAGQAAAAAPAGEPATLNLGAIAVRLGFALTAVFVTESLGIKPAATDKRSVLFRQSQWPEIKAALVRWVGGLQ